MTIGERLKEWRKANNIKTVELSQKTGISTGALSNYENDKREINSTFLLEIEKKYNADIYYILTGVRKSITNLTENETEMLQYFKMLPEREQIKFIGKIEDVAKQYENKGKLSDSKIG